MFSNYFTLIKRFMSRIKSYSRVYGLLLALGLLIGGPGWSNNLPELGSEFREVISVRDEGLVGDSWMWQLRASGMVQSDPLVNEYLRYLGHRLTPYMDMPYSNIRIKFFGIDDKTVNAFAFFGGHVAIHSGLILFTGNESELAAVMAHELAHVSQQHVLRQIAEDKKMLPVTIAETLAVLALGRPELLLPVMAGHSQHMLNYSRRHELEADRLGLQILSRAKFDPESLPIVLERMGTLTRFHNLPPEYLLTHPLHDTRVSDARNRAHEFTNPRVPSSQMYHWIKARVEVQTAENLIQLITDYEHKLKTKRYANEPAMQYAYAYALFKQEKYSKAWQVLQPLTQKYPQDIVIQLTAADIEHANRQSTAAINRMEKLVKLYPDGPSIMLNYAQLLIENKQPLAAQKILEKFKKLHSPEPDYYELVRQTEGMLNNQVGILEANAEWYLLHGDVYSSLGQLESALDQVKEGSREQSRIKNRIATIKDLLQKIKAV